jgi:hypothetical protein
MPDTFGHAVGHERWELLTRSKGNTDPYEMNITEIKESTRENPNLVPCTIETRIVGCICEYLTCGLYRPLNKFYYVSFR